MSDSYSAWCEDREERILESENKREAFEKIKNSKEFKDIVKNIRKEFKNIKFTECKCCFNCEHFNTEYTDSYGNTLHLCLKHCIDLKNWSENHICDKWEMPKHHKRQFSNRRSYFKVDPFIVSLQT